MISPQDCLGCQISSGILTPFGGFIYASDLWTVNHVLPPARILGWMVLQPRRHVEAIHELNHSEQVEMAKLISNLDQVLYKLVSPQKVYACMFAESEDCPHIHFHIVPRTSDINAIGPAIFGYKPEVFPSESEILDFIDKAKSCLSALAL
ncbi:MAG: hypothetical protein F6J96_25410 [Symploca sp. SIO1C2]|nr:hypothetical protein [Symploca sp. SIO1C2]NER46490.1 hypothetical protein [Symploca sp. SIO1A3]